MVGFATRRCHMVGGIIVARIRGDMGRLGLIPIHQDTFRVVGTTRRGRSVTGRHVQRFRRTKSSCMECHWVRTVQAVYLIMESTGLDGCTMAPKVKLLCLSGRRKVKVRRPKCGRQEGKGSKTKMRKARGQKGANHKFHQGSAPGKGEKIKANIAEDRNGSRLVNSS